MKHVKENIHPCGDCVYYGEDCMKNMEECEYSDKEILKKIKE